MLVATQQAFSEASIYDPATNIVSVYHPLVIDAGTTPAAAPVVPVIPAGATVGLWFGFNGGVLKLVDSNGLDTNNSPSLKGSNCINGLAGVQNDVFGQVSWCNAQQFFAAVNAGGPTIPPLGVDTNGNPCPTSRSYELVDACPSDNVPTQYLLLPNGQTAQDTAANRAANPTATIINNASDEALLTNILDPLIGCTPFKGPSLDDPGVTVPALALSEMQANALQAAPIGFVPINDPDCLLTASGTVSTQKTDQYRLGVNQPVVAAGNDSGALDPYCSNMLTIAPPFLKGFETLFTGQTTPAACVGNNLFTFLAQRFLTSLTQLTCPVAQEVIPISCAQDGNGVATSCTINLTKTALGTGAAIAATATATSKKGGAGAGAGATTASAPAATATGGSGAKPKPSN
jgi:hypothetical protein